MLDIAKWFLVCTTITAIIYLIWDIVSKRRRVMAPPPRTRSMYFSIVGKRVQPGAVITISSPMSYNTTFYPRQLLIPEAVGRCFSIVELKIGNVSQLATSPIPAILFMPPAPRSFSPTDFDDGAPISDRVDLHMDPIKPGDDITLIAQNMSDEAMDFSAAIVGKVQVRAY